jgi:hypothetical protein
VAVDDSTDTVYAINDGPNSLSVLVPASSAPVSRTIHPERLDSRFAS